VFKKLFSVAAPLLLFASVSYGQLPPADAIDLGLVAFAGEPFTISTFGSDLDTELGLYDSSGFLLDSNDNAGSGNDSELVSNGLDAGIYYLALGESQTEFEFGFVVTTEATDGGEYQLNYTDVSRIETLAGGTVQFFVFEIVVGGFVPPAEFATVRGLPINASLSDFLDSDDIDAAYNPGFTLNSAEAPVLLVFDGVATIATAFRVESSAGTVGLGYTVEAWNWATGAYDIIGTSSETFNSDSTEDFAIVPADHIEPGTGNVRSRVGWRRVSFTINFPWVVNVDHVGWVQ